LGGVFAGETERVSGKSVMTPPRSRVIGWLSYWLTTGTSGPTPKSRPMGFISTTRSSPMSKPYFARYFRNPSAWKGAAMKKTFPPRPM
jgi:hypothetical protein